MNVTDITPAVKTTGSVRFAAYCRVSSDSADQLHSFAAQIRYYKDYERMHPVYRMVDIYADEGITGTSMEKRDEMNRLLRDCQKGKIDRVIVKSVSRFARNTEELLATLRALRTLNVSVYFEEQDIDTSKLNMEMIVTFPGMAAQQESESISGNVRWSYRKRMEAGEFNCNTPAYGVDMRNGALVVNEVEAAVVRRIFDLYLHGEGKQSIAVQLNRDGVPRRMEGARWHAGTVSYILNNERYMGDALLQKKYTTETLPYRKMKNHGELPQYYVENSNPPIVSRAVYTAAQQLQRERASHSHRRGERYPLSGVLKCATCGSTYRRQVIRGRIYWVCSGKSLRGIDCADCRVSEAAVYETFHKMMVKLQAYQKELLGSAMTELERLRARCGMGSEKLQNLNRKLADLAAQNHVIAKLYASGVLNDAEFSAQSADLQRKISSVRAERKRELETEESGGLLEQLQTLRDAAEQYDLRRGFDADIFREVVRTIHVKNRREVVFELIGGLKLSETVEME